MNNDIENRIDGYKYILELSISIENPLDTSNGDRICICDTRDECIEIIKEEIQRYQDANSKENIEIIPEPYNITRLGTYIKWKKGDKQWWWNFGIYPVRYINSK